MGFARGRGGDDDGAAGVFGATGTLSGWDLEMAIFWGCYGAGVGCSGSTVTPSSSGTPVLAGGWVRAVTCFFLSGSLGCHEIPQKRAVTPQNIQVDASVSPSGDCLCPA